MYIVVKEHDICLSYEHDGEQYGSWEEHRDYSISAKKVAESYKASYSEEGYTLPDSDIFYVVYMIYSNGDSFGHSSGHGCILMTTIHKDKAEAFKKYVEDSSDEDYTLTYVDDFGKEVQVSNPGAGYFESIDSVYIEEFKV